MIETKYSFTYNLIDNKNGMIVRTIVFDSTFTLERIQMKLDTEKKMYMRVNGINRNQQKRFTWD